MSPDVDLVLATTEHLQAFLRGRDELAAMLGGGIPEGWPEFPEAIPFTLDALAQQPDPSPWSMYFFLDAQTGGLVGSGGFAFAPRDRVTEIGYEIAPSFRGRGYGTAAARGLVDLAAASDEVDVVLAHTLAEPSASTGVLTKLGFTKVADLVDLEDGPLWQWRLQLRWPTAGSARA